MADEIDRTSRPRRQTGPKRRDKRELLTRKRAGVVAGAAVFGFALGVLAAVVGADRWDDGGSTGSPEQALAAAGCTSETFPDEGGTHVESYDAKVKYDSFPPTSGPHYVRPVIWGRYQDAIPAVAEAHNLEHGGVIVQYGDKIGATTRVQLRVFYDDSPNAMVLAPLPELGDKITLTAWTRLATCKRFDESAFSAFRSAYRGKGPERFPIDDLAPGT